MRNLAAFLASALDEAVESEWEDKKRGSDGLGIIKSRIVHQF